MKWCLIEGIWYVFSLQECISIHLHLQVVISNSCHVVKWNEPDLTILPLIGTQSIRLELSTGIPSHILPVVGQTVKYQSRSRSNSMEMFGVGKDQSEEEEEEVIVDELNSLLLINHNFTADVLDIKTCERKHLSNDVIAAFLLHSTDLPPFAQTSIVLYGKHRYNVDLLLFSYIDMASSSGTSPTSHERMDRTKTISICFHPCRIPPFFLVNNLCI